MYYIVNVEALFINRALQISRSTPLAISGPIPRLIASICLGVNC